MADRFAMSGLLKKGMLGGIYVFAFSIPVSFVPAQLGIATSFICWLLHGILAREWLIRRDRILVILAAYIGWNSISSMLSPRPMHSLLAVVDNEWPLLIGLMCWWAIPDVRHLKRIITVFLGVSSAVMLYAVWQTVGGVEVWRGLALTPFGSFYRSVGFYGFYLTFAGLALSTFFLAANMAWEHRGERRERWMFPAISFVSFLALIFTFARSMWVAWALLLPAVGFVRNRKAGGWMAGGLLVVLLVAGGSSESVRSRAVSAFIPSENETRLNLWKTSLMMAGEFPLTGIGQDNFDYWFEAFKVEGFYDVSVHPHNDYLTVLVSSGVPGFLLWVTLWVLVLRAAFRTFRRTAMPMIRAASSGAGLGIAGYLAGAFFQNYYGTFANCLGWWFLAGLVLAAERLSLEFQPQDLSRNSSIQS